MIRMLQHPTGTHWRVKANLGLWCCGLFLALTTAASAQPACKPPGPEARALELKVSGAEPVVFSAAGDDELVTLVLQLPPSVQPGDLTGPTLQVRRGKSAGRDLNAHFSPEPLQSTGPGSALLKIRISRIGQLAPGQYQAALLLRHRCALPVLPLAFTLERPDALMTGPGTVVIDVRAAHGFGAENPVPSPRTIDILPTDHSSASALRAPLLAERDWKTATGKALSPTLGASASSAAAGQPLTISLAPKGFPVGTVKGKLELRSPDLKLPITVDVEVRTRIADGWILPIVATGILLGLGLRTWLPGFVAVRQARAGGVQVQLDLNARTSAIKDPLFLTTWSPALLALDKTWKSGDASSIAAAQVAAKETFETTHADLTRRLLSAQELLKALRRLQSGAGALPGPMQGAVDALQAPCELAASALKDSNAVGAQATLDPARDKVLEALATAWPAWRQSVRTLDVDVARLRCLFDPALNGARGLGSAGNGDLPFAEELLGPLQSGLDLPDPQDLAALARGLDAWRAAGIARRAMLQQWRGFLVADGAKFSEMVTERVGDSASIDAAFDAWQQAFNAVQESLDHLINHTDAFGSVPVPTATCLDTTTHLLAEMLAAKTDLSDERRQTASAAVSQTRFFDALRHVPPLATRRQDAALRAPQAGATAHQDRMIRALSRPLVTDRIPALPVIDASVLELMRQRFVREAVVAQWWQTLLVAVVALVGSYVFFEDRFIGTTAEVAGLFFWGLSADLSAAGLFGVAAGWATAPKKPAP